MNQLDIDMTDGEDAGEGPVGYELRLAESNWDAVHALAHRLNSLTGIVATTIGPVIRVRDDHEPKWLVRQIEQCIRKIGRKGRISYITYV